MSDKKRKLLLAGLLTLVVLYLVGESAYQRYFVKPLAAEQQRQKDLKDELHKIKLATLRTKNNLQYVATYQERSLPSQTEFAVSQYHDWLLNLVETSGLKRYNLTSSSPSATRALLRRINFTVRGTGTLKQITRFLYSFYEAGHLHKIRSITLNPSATGKLTTTVSIEAVSLANAKSKQKLSQTTANRLAGDSLRFYDVINRRDLFQGTGASWATQTSLTGITKDRDGKIEAWFDSKLKSGPQVRIKLDETDRVGDLDVTVLQRTDRGIKLLIDGDEFEMRLGQTFAECFELN